MHYNVAILTNQFYFIHFILLFNINFLFSIIHNFYNLNLFLTTYQVLNFYIDFSDLR